MGSDVLQVRGIQFTSDRFRWRLAQVARNVQVPLDYLATVIAFETAGTWNPSEPNRAGSPAVGLIQFMPDTATSLGTSTEALRAMSDVEQLDWVERYYRPFRGRLHSLDDAYLAVLHPDFLAKPPDEKVFVAPSKGYMQNIGFDRPDAEGNRKGYVTVADVSAAIWGTYYGAGGKRFPVPEEEPPDSFR